MADLDEVSGSQAVSPDPDAPFWTTRDVADLLGVKLETVHRYMADTRYCQELIAKGYELPPEKLAAVMPPPDARFGRTPVWRPATIQEWVRRRPGRGAGGGRPRKNRSSD